MPPKAKPNVNFSKQQNDSIQNEIETLCEKVKCMEETLKSFEAAARDSFVSSNPETEKTLEFMGQEYDDLNAFRVTAMRDIKALTTRLNSIDMKMRPSTDRELVTHTRNLCVRLFNEMGANVNHSDIDIAHRVRTRNPKPGSPKPIVGEFVRRIVRDEVMAVRIVHHSCA